MKLPKLNLTIDKIYLAAVGIMLITLAMNIWSLREKWQFLILPDKIASLAGLAMTALWAYFFFFLYKSIPKEKNIITIPQKSDDEMLKLMEKEVNENAKNK